MFKKIPFIYLLIFLIVFILSTIIAGSYTVYKYKNKIPFTKIDKLLIYSYKIPIYFVKIFTTGNKLDPLLNGGAFTNIKPIKNKNGEYKRFYKKEFKPRPELLVIARYDKKKSKSIVEIIDLENLNAIHTYPINVEKIFKNYDLSVDFTEERYQNGHPLILEDGSLISKNVMHSPIFKLGLCGDLKWSKNMKPITFHHSLEMGLNDNFWVGSTLYEKKNRNYEDDAIVGINQNTGKINFKKSIGDLLVENKILTKNNLKSHLDPIHVNDIQPVHNDGPYWKRGDLFISILRQSAIIHYDPKNNIVKNYIQGPFKEQHDIDIISDTEIAIFNNNNTKKPGKEFSEIIFYNFKKKKFSRKNAEILKKLKFKTYTEGLADYFDDGSMIVEETNHGRIILINHEGIVEWIFLNIYGNGNIRVYPISWMRLIKDNLLVEKIKQVINNNTCD